MIQELHQLWVDLGEPSWVSATNFLLIVVYLVNKLLDTFSKSKRDQEIQDHLELLNYRLSKLEDSSSLKYKS
jgi:hypothetical protein